MHSKGDLVDGIKNDLGRLLAAKESSDRYLLVMKLRIQKALMSHLSSCRITRTKVLLVYLEC